MGTIIVYKLMKRVGTVDPGCPDLNPGFLIVTLDRAWNVVSAYVLAVIA
jgi:hypothetical protein